MTQSHALSILKTGVNVFLTGEPGSGKTHTINEYAAYLRSHGIEPAITASTGIAATHIGGMTVHSWSGIGIKTTLNKYDLDKISSNKQILRRVRSAKVLIIDEVSMLSAETLSMIAAVCRSVKESAEPFGGIQIVLVGDFFQLPPIVRLKTERNPQTMLIKETSARFVFDSPLWERVNPEICYLTEQHRQDDDNFLDLLSAIRRGVFSENHLERIKTRKIDRHTAPNGVPRIFSHNVSVDRVNDEILAKLPGRSKAFTMFSDGPSPLISALKKGCLSPETLYLKEDTAVMFTKNNSKEGFVNGTFGAVVRFDEHDGYPIVKTRNGRQIQVKPTSWTVEENGRIRGQITQLPLRLAWAITVHKSQGMSLDEAVMDLSDVFEFGQGYVALSRVRRLSGLHLLGWNERTFQAHPEILEKDAKFRAQSEETARIFSGIAEEEKVKVRHRRFIRACGGKILLEENNDENPSRVSRIAGERGSGGREQRWERTIALIRSGKTIAAVAKIRGRTEGTILEHLESLRAFGKLPREDIAHLARGSERAIAEIQDVFRELGADKLSAIFEKLGGRYSYNNLRIARLMLE